MITAHHIGLLSLVVGFVMCAIGIGVLVEALDAFGSGQKVDSAMFFACALFLFANAWRAWGKE